mmetsp:Transcript_27346/g.66499  ORF Transcript_27346/g.66499 Transcript_27346/m.66499 type:complete len:509 (-) Transcript_27346:158-1684(-)|eukprot:CAMPEP_0114506786 /NCGR_PEP_ID=MMETSP0109-20121206/11627_1 /TAXON_ID=29199 /ORGANISM="Chlorarachnion reptans, Strain CCCM449" /LENGTH=508 /DNA_ID=CAMNT_0001685425 /DNA_START=260 /DNA_END=1786 /DNA_ORIENTATION=-
MASKTTGNTTADPRPDEHNAEGNAQNVPQNDDATFQKRVEQLRKWLLANGARFPKVEINRYASEGRDLRTLQKLDKGEEAIFIPRKCIIAISDGKKSKAGQAIKSETRGWVSNHTYLAVQILTERSLGEKSFFYPWLQVLPSDYKAQGMPQYWSKEQRKELENSKTLGKSDGVLENISEMWKTIKNVTVVKDAGWTLEEFKWARFTVLTRTFGCTENGAAETMMVPLADMANHDFNRPTRWDYNDKKAGFTVRVVKSVNKGELLTDTYGNKGNDSFLPVYGFCVEHNNWNQARIALPLKNLKGLKVPNLERLHVSKCAYDYNDGKHKYIDASCDTQASGSSRGGKELFSYTRAIVATESEVNSLRPVLTSATCLDPVSPQNEVQALNLIKEKAGEILDKFSTSLEEDLRILEDKKRAPKHSWYRNAVLARSGEKATLRYYQRLAETMVPLLQCKNMSAVEKHPNYKKLKDASKKENFGYYAGRYFEYVIHPLMSGKGLLDNGARGKGK